MNEIGNKIKNLRKALGYNQKDICNDILSRTELSKIENGRRTPSIYQIKYISDILNTSADYLLDVNTKKNEHTGSNDNKSNIEKLFSSKQYHKITISFEKGNIFNDNDIDNLFFVGAAYYKTEFYVESKKILLKFIKEYEGLNYDTQEEYCENYAEALINLFYMENSSKNKDIEMSKLYKAKNEIEKHEKINSKIYLKILYHIGFVYFYIDRFSDAVSVLSSLVDKSKKTIELDLVPDTHLILARVYYNTDQYAESLRNLDDALFLYKYSNNNSSIVCSIDYANVYRFMGQYNEAVKSIEEADSEYLKNNKFDKIFLLYKAFIYFNMTDYEAVMQQLKQIKITDLNCYTKKSSYYFLKGHIAYVNNQYEDAVKYLKKSEKFFKINNYCCDLKLLYNDLYSITKDDEYKKLYDKYSVKFIDCKKNIIESFDIDKYIAKK